MGFVIPDGLNPETFPTVLVPVHENVHPGMVVETRILFMVSEQMESVKETLLIAGTGFTVAVTDDRVALMQVVVLS
jgi:hypothetical protein